MEDKGSVELFYVHSQGSRSKTACPVISIYFINDFKNGPTMTNSRLKESAQESNMTTFEFSVIKYTF